MSEFFSLLLEIHLPMFLGEKLQLPLTTFIKHLLITKVLLSNSTPNLQTQPIFSWSEKELTVFPYNSKNKNTSLAAPGALAHRLQNPKWLPDSPKMADRAWKGVQF